MTELTQFRLSLKLDATLAVNGGNGFQNWIKPGVEASVTWDGLPSDDQIAAATTYLQQQIVEPIVAQVVETAAERVRELEGNI